MSPTNEARTYHRAKSNWLCESGPASSILSFSQPFRYSDYDADEPFGAPFHPPCFRVFAQSLRYQLSGEVAGVVDQGIVDKKILYTVASGLHEEYAHCLKLDYEELSDDVRDQYWACMPGEEVSLNEIWRDELFTDGTRGLGSQPI